MRLDKGLYNRLVSRGSMKRLVTEDAGARRDARTAGGHQGLLPRAVPRALRGRVAAASWDSVIFDLGRESLVRIPTLEPLRGTRRHVGELLDASNDAEELVDALTRG